MLSGKQTKEGLSQDLTITTLYYIAINIERLTRNVSKGYGCHLLKRLMQITNAGCGWRRMDGQG